MFSNAKAVMEAEASGALAAFNFETGYLDNHFVVGRNGGGPAQITVPVSYTHLMCIRDRNGAIAVTLTSSLVIVPITDSFAP